MVQIEVFYKKDSLGIFDFPSIPRKGDIISEGMFIMYYTVKSIRYHLEKNGSVKVIMKVE